jgi:hypothetical protein
MRSRDTYELWVRLTSVLKYYSYRHLPVAGATSLLIKYYFFETPQYPGTVKGHLVAGATPLDIKMLFLVDTVRA